ncbi:hypothetical protein BDV10DRAFT_177737 [Aspergillus recurvatus]
MAESKRARPSGKASICSQPTLFAAKLVSKSTNCSWPCCPLIRVVWQCPPVCSQSPAGLGLLWNMHVCSKGEGQNEAVLTTRT